MRRNVLKRPQDERAPMHLGVRQDQLSVLALPSARTPDAPATVVEDVDIERARGHAGRKLPAGSALQPLDEAQQCRRRHSRAHGEHRIEVVRLPSATDRCGCVEVGASDYFDTSRFEFVACPQQAGTWLAPAPAHIRAKRKLHCINHFELTKDAVYSQSCEAFCHARHYVKNGSCALGNCSPRSYVSL